MTLIALICAIVVPNLGAFIPEARIQGSGNQIIRTVDFLRSEARIQGKRMSMDFDLDHGLWRKVLPPEQRLTRDQDAATLEEQDDQWKPLEDDVKFGGAGDARNFAEKGVYRLTFDEYGFSGDQMIVLKLVSDPNIVWTLTLQGLTGRMTVDESDKGQVPTLAAPTEGAF